ncbi:MAG: flagellar hook protein FlgE [Zoogloea sp.]|uniref:flagellar hook protein FlgE n=1 Tax=Zoogloea sp. TaxID=49181 RepID=UPI0026149B1A|nr:flagellar hook protein FlgE [Zoogloea sp.]MDD3328568.1 flagellar hook protein FlgE [Zoogloea sp.]
MAFQQGLSGLSIASKALDAISNNVSNSGTVGYKQAGAQFADVFAASLSAGSSTQVGIGASVATVAQQFTQGNISTSSSTLDLAVNGQGFFRMSDNGAITYTRNGQFHVDKNGYVVNSSGLRLTGNTYDAKGLPNGVGGDIRLSYGDADPKATTEAGYNVNLDSRSTSPAALTVATLYGTSAPASVGTPLVLTAANNQLTIAVDGEASATVTIPAGSYADSSSLVAALQTAIDQTSLKGRVVASSNSNGVLSLASERGGRLSSLLVSGSAAGGLQIPTGVTVNGSNAVVATLSSASVAPFAIAPVPAAGTTSTLSIAVDGGAAIPVTINAATYPDSASLVAALQTAVNATALNGKVVVGADAAGRITFSSTLAGGQSSMAVTGGVATDLAMPTFTATANSGGFSITDPTSYTSTTSQTVYDSLGNPHTQSLYFVKTAQANKWDVYTSLDGGFPPEIDPITGLHSPTTVSFDSNGGLLTPKTIATTYTVTTGATRDLTITVDLNNSTQFGNSFGVSSLNQDGYKPGTLSGLTVEADGTILGNFSNGQSRTMGQVLLTNFRNPNGLVSVGANQWQWTPEAGAVDGAGAPPGTGTLGVLQSAAIEESNVDLTSELVNMITQQRAYQANAQSIKTQDQILQTLVNLR